MYVRHLDEVLQSHFSKYREIIILLGPRQAGKTTLVTRLFPQAQYLNIDLDPTKNALDTYDLATYKRILQPDANVIIFDEAQRLKDPGRAIKIIYDQIPKYKLVVTGSSAFNIKNKTSESLAGRKIGYQIFPLTISEFLVQQNLESTLSFSPLLQIIHGDMPHEIVKLYDHRSILDQIMLYGLYPASLNRPLDSTYLYNMIDSIIFKDLNEFSLLENKNAAISLLKLLAHQVGSLVNYAELAVRLGIDAKTVKRYIELFEQSFIIFTLKPYSTNMRDEIGKMPKVYFYDLGLRNALIKNFQPIDTRGDFGVLFENFVVSELHKYNIYGNFEFQLNFWRTKSGSEIDLVLSKPDGTLLAVEIKNKSKRVNQSFKVRYPTAQLVVVSRDNYWV